MNCQFQRADGGRALSEAVGIADHDSKSGYAHHLSDNRRWIRDMVQQAERHYDIKTAVMEGEMLAASVMQDGSERLSLFAEFVNRLYPLNLKFGASLS
jgi:hypothetical protein